MDAYDEAAMDAGYRGEEAKQVARELEEQERRKDEQRELELRQEQDALDALAEASARKDTDGGEGSE